MPIPSGTYPIGGPILDISGGPLTPSAALRTAGVVALRGGKVTRVNAAGDGWEEVPGHVIAATAPTEVFEGQLWYDTTAAALKHYNGTAFVAVAGSSTAIADLAVTTAKLADLSVTTAKLAADAVTPAKLDAGDATKRLNLRTRLASAALDSPTFTGEPKAPTPLAAGDDTQVATKKYVDDNAGAGLADGAVTTAKLAANAVTAAKIQNEAVTADALATNSVGTDALASSAVTEAKLGVDSVSSAKIEDNAVGTTEIADDAVTPAKVDADNATKQDLFLTRLNALRRDLNNIATLTSAEQRTLLLALGSLIDGPRPAPSAVYSARTWIDDHDDRAYVCRNRQEVSAVLGGGFADFNTSAEGVEIAENLADLDDPASTSDYAYTYSDNKWWKGTTVGSADVWRETPPAEALSASLTTTQGWATVWLGRHRWDYNARQQLPQSALPANTDYYFFNSRTVTIRKFNRASYVATGTVLDHWQWEPLTATAAEIDIIEARDGNLPPLANDGTDDRQIAVANDGIHFVQLIPEAATAATTGAWASYAYSTSSPARAYIGVLAQDDPSGSVVGDFYYNSTWHRWRIYRSAGAWAWFNDHWEDLSDEDVAWPVRFVGYHRSRAEATAYAASSGITTGQTFVAFTGSEIETGSQFFQGTSARFSRHWRFLPLDPPTSTRTLYIEDVFAMPGGTNVHIADTLIGRNWKTVYGVDHTVSISTIKIQVRSTEVVDIWQIALLKGFAPNAPNEDTIHVSEVLWPRTNAERIRSAQIASIHSQADHIEHTFDIPEVEVNRGEFLVVQLARLDLTESNPNVRTVSDLTEHHAFNAFRFVGSGADDRDSSQTANFGVDNVEWTDGGLWIEIGYAIKYDVDAAIATHGADDFVQVGTFTLAQKELSLRLTRELGEHVDVPSVDLAPLGVPDLLSITKGQLATAVQVDLKTDAQVTSLAETAAVANYTSTEKAKLQASPADLSITTDKLGANAVTEAKIDNNSVGPSKLIASNPTEQSAMQVRIGAAGLASPTFTGEPKAPTPLAAGDDTQVATKEYVDDNAGAVADDAVTPAKLDAGTATKRLNLRTRLASAALDSPVFTGTPSADTALPGTNTEQLATTAFVAGASIGVADDSITPAKMDAGDDIKRLALRTRFASAALASPVFTGVPKAPHPTNASPLTQITTKRYVDENISAAAGSGLGDPTEIRAEEAAGSTNTATTITLSGDLVKGRLLEFLVYDVIEATRVKSVGYVMSDLILGLAAQATRPAIATLTNPRVVLQMHEAGNATFGTDSLHIWRHADSNKLYVVSGKSASIRLSINAYDLSSSGGGGGATGNATGAGGTSASGGSNTLRLQLILHQWGDTQPASPTVHWISTGFNGPVDGDATSSWVEDVPTTTPAGTHWIALANAYSGDAGATWATYNWSVFSVGAGYLAEQYSEDASSWHTTRTDNDSWMRLRRPDGTWTGSIALGPVPWQPIMDWADVYRPDHTAAAKVAWKFNINEVDLLAYNDLALEAQFFYYTNGPPDDFSAVARTSIPFGTAKKDGVLGTYTPSTELRWQTLPQDFLLTDWTSTVAARVARRLGVFRAVLDRDEGLSVVLGEGARSTTDDVAYQHATICFGLQSAAVGSYGSTINAVAIYVPPGTQAYSRTQIRIVGR